MRGSAPRNSPTTLRWCWRGSCERRLLDLRRANVILKLDRRGRHLNPEPALETFLDKLDRRSRAEISSPRGSAQLERHYIDRADVRQQGNRAGIANQSERRRS